MTMRATRAAGRGPAARSGSNARASSPLSPTLPSAGMAAPRSTACSSHAASATSMFRNAAAYIEDGSPTIGMRNIPPAREPTTAPKLLR